MSELFERLRPHLDRGMALETALTLFNWDTETLAPTTAVERTAKVVGILSGEYYEAVLNPQVRELLAALQAPGEREKLTDAERAMVKELQKNTEELERIPPREYRDYSRLLARAGSIWANAREKGDFSLFEPVLTEIVDTVRRFAGYRAKPGQSLYDVYLEDYEEGFGAARLESFFGELREAVVPLLRRIRESGREIDRSFNARYYPAPLQREFCKKLSQAVGFDYGRGAAGESAHPFTTALHNRDVRYTNHFDEHCLDSALFSAIHESGHGIYEQNIADELTQTPVGKGASMGVHESQSRFFENMVGRSRAFWVPLYPRLQETFPEQLGDVTLDGFVAGINRVEPSLIRIHADELTYPLHIMVRFELEKALFAGELQVHDLPGAWNEKYREYLGVTPPDDGQGVLQDTHWAGGMFGYFPTYALGSAIAAQLYAHLKKKLPFEELLESGNLAPIREELREHIHRFGATKTTDELLKAMTGEGFQAHYYVEYLEEKYSRLYGV